MKFLILSSNYSGDILYHRLVSEQHECWLINPFHRDNGVSTISNIFIGLINKPDVVIVTNPGFENEASLCRSKGFKVFGGAKLEAKLELEDNTARNFCKAYNVRWLKPDTKILYPISTEIWFSDGDPVYQYFGYVKQNKFLTGDLGPDTEGESILFWSYPDRNVEAVNRIFENGLFNILKTIKHTGILAFDSYISEDDHYPYIFKIIPRLQSVVLTAMLELYSGNLGLLFYNILNNIQCSILLKDSVSIAVAISVPPYPYNQSGFVKYLVASDKDFLVARKKIAREIKTLDIPNIQYRIDAGLQGEYLEEFRKIHYISS